MGDEGSGSSQVPPVALLGVAVVAVVIAFLVIALFPRSTPDPVLPPPAGQAVVAPHLQRWEAVYEAITDTRVDPPPELPGGYALASLTQWRPGWSSTGTIWSGLLVGDNGWMLLCADPPSLQERSEAEVFDVPGLAALRAGAGDGLAVLEWRDSGYTMRVEGGGVAVAELQRVAAGIESPSLLDDGALVFGYLPDGFPMPEQPGVGPSTVGPGEAGWLAGYRRAGDGGRVTLTAATDRSFPFGELFGLAPDHQTRLRGYWGLVFDNPAGTDDALRSRLLWPEEGSMLEATSNHLSAVELLALVEPLDLGGREAAVLRTSTARSRLGWLGRGGPGDDGAGRLAATELLNRIGVNG